MGEFLRAPASGSRLFSCESVWARAGADGEWLRVGAVVTKSDDVSNADAVAAQKKLISWSATQLFPALNAKKGRAPNWAWGPTSTTRRTTTATRRRSHP